MGALPPWFTTTAYKIHTKVSKSGLTSMKQLGSRLRALREGIGISQTKFADVIGSTQFSINRYENGQATPTVELLRKYADYFDVSMNYIFARCDEPQGKLYQAKPRLARATLSLLNLWKCALIRLLR